MVCGMYDFDPVGDGGPKSGNNRWTLGSPGCRAMMPSRSDRRPSASSFSRDETISSESVPSSWGDGRRANLADGRVPHSDGMVPRRGEHAARHFGEGEGCDDGDDDIRSKTEAKWRCSSGHCPTPNPSKAEEYS